VKPSLRAIAIGCGIEACLAGFFAVSGFGPCGPSYPLGFVGVIGHIPGLLVFEALNQLVHIPDALGTALMIAAQAIMFSAIAYWIGTRRGCVEAT
jgi:hypothetical protein